jgi:hypothetical protein
MFHLALSFVLIYLLTIYFHKLLKFEIFIITYPLLILFVYSLIEEMSNEDPYMQFITNCIIFVYAYNII